MAKGKNKYIKTAIVFILLSLFICIFWMVQNGNKKSFSWRGYRMRLRSDSEVPLSQTITCENRQIGYFSPTIITFDVIAKVDPDQHDKLDKLISQNSLQIKDGIRDVVASAKTYQLTDPKLESISRQIQQKVEKIVGKGVIKEILIPYWHTE